MSNADDSSRPRACEANLAKDAVFMGSRAKCTAGLWLGVGVQEKKFPRKPKRSVLHIPYHILCLCADVGLASNPLRRRKKQL